MALEKSAFDQTNLLLVGQIMCNYSVKILNISCRVGHFHFQTSRLNILEKFQRNHKILKKKRKLKVRYVILVGHFRLLAELNVVYSVC